MKPKIDDTKFGSITISGNKYHYDIVIGIDGEVKKRKKKLSKQVYGSSHTVSLDEAKNIYQDGAEKLVVGNGQYGVLELSDEAKTYFRKKDCSVVIKSTPEAVEEWNSSPEQSIAMFHITC